MSRVNDERLKPPKPSVLQRELRGLLVLYLVVGVVSAIVATQCVSAP